MYSNLNDIACMDLLKQGDEAAFNEIYNRFQPLLYVYACRITKDENEAEDIVQEVFIYLWDKRASIMPEGSPAAYLYTAVRYRFFDRLDRKKIRAGYQESLQRFMEQGEYCIDDYIRERELARLIEQAVASLPSKMQEIFTLSRNEALSHREIATRLDLSEKTVKNQVHNALKILRTRLGLFNLLFSFLYL